jgi:WD40 repeat protein
VSKTQDANETRLITQRRGSPTILQRMVDRIFGYDLFISYSWGDSANYAEKLKAGLQEQGFVCFLDKYEYGAGDNLKTAARRALARTGVLVVVLSNEALQSKYVRQEVEIFQPTGRKIILIDTQDLRGLMPEAELFTMVGEDVLDVRREVGSLADGPSSTVIAEIVKSFRLTRQDRKRTRWFAAIAALLLVLAVTATSLAWLADRGRREAERQAGIAKRQLQVAIAKQVAVRAIRSSDEDLDLALLLAVQGTRIDDSWETRDSLLRALQKARGISAFLYAFNTPRGTGVAFSGNGRFIALRTGSDLITVYDTASNLQHQIVVPMDEPCLATAVAADGKFFVIARRGLREEDEGWPNLEFRDTLTGALVKIINFDEECPKCCEIETPSGGASELTVPVIESTESPTGSEKLILRGKFKESVCAYTPDGCLALCQDPEPDSDNPSAKLWDLASCKIIATLHGLEASQWKVAFSSAANSIAGIDEDNSLVLWDVATGKPRSPLFQLNSQVTRAAFHPNGKTLATAGTNNEVATWDVRTGTKLNEWRSADTSRIRKMIFNHDGKKLATVGVANKVTVWDLDRLPLPRELVVSDLSHLLDNPVLQALKKTATNRLRSERKISRPYDEKEPYYGPLLLALDNYFLAISFGREIAIVELPKGKLLCSFELESEPIAVAFDKESSLLALLDTKKVTRTTFSRGAVHTASVHDPGIALTVTGRLEATQRPLSGAEMRGAVKIPDTIEIRDAQTHDLVMEPLNLTNVFQIDSAWGGGTLALKSDGKILASMRSSDGVINLFDTDEKLPIGGPIWKPEVVREDNYRGSEALAFSTDGKRMAVAREKELLLLDVDLTSWKRQACRKANRNLSETEWIRYVGKDVPYEKTCPELP